LAAAAGGGGGGGGVSLPLLRLHQLFVLVAVEDDFHVRVRRATQQIPHLMTCVWVVQKEKEEKGSKA